MESALMASRGGEKLVSALEIQREYRGRVPSGKKLLCPLCRQPLFPAAMEPRAKQSPHFRHEKNNPRAHECERYASSVGFFSAYQRAPMPLFIRRAKTNGPFFVVECGLRPLGDHRLAQLESEAATLHIGKKQYRVTRERFGSGLVKLPIEEIELNCGSCIRLASKSYSLYGTWGYPEDAHEALVFTRDEDSQCGKRMALGSMISFGMKLYLLVPAQRADMIKEAFSESVNVGFAGPRFARLVVYEVIVSKDSPSWRESVQFLESCGYKVSDYCGAPKLVWPPALTSGGDLTPLFNRTKCVFTIANALASQNDLFVHTSACIAGKTKKEPLGLLSTSVKCGCVDNDADFTFVSADDGVSPTAAFLCRDLNVLERIPANDACLPIVEQGERSFNILLRKPGTLRLYQSGKATREIRVREPATSSLETNYSSCDVLRVYSPLYASLDDLVIYEAPVDEDGMTKRAVCTAEGRRGSLLRMTVPRDVARAQRRESPSVFWLQMGRDKAFALSRKDAK